MRYTWVMMSMGLFASPASACLCNGTDSVKEAFSRATAVFAGRYIGSEYRQGIRNQLMDIHVEAEKASYEMLVHKFEVATWWKGAGTREVVLISDNGRLSNGTEVISDCGLSFESGRDYLVYAYGTGDDFGTGACTRTANLKRGAKDRQQLSRIAKPFRPKQ